VNIYLTVYFSSGFPLNLQQVTFYAITESVFPLHFILVLFHILLSFVE